MCAPLPAIVAQDGSRRSITYSYDPQGRISQVATQPRSGTPVTVLAGNFVHAYPFAGPQSFQYGNGQAFNQSRDQDYRPVTAVDGPYQKTYSHDPAGNVASLTDIGNTVLSYSYDSSGRLTGATDTAAGSFGLLGYIYDPNGNRQSETRNAGTLPYVYSPPNWLYQRGSDTRPRTANGNTASISGVASFSYDGYNRLATSQTAAETTTYTYNALGQRIKKINQNGLSTVFHYGPNGELLYERDANGNTKAYVWLEGRPLARIDNDAQIYYYHVDHLGTPQAMTNAAGTTVWRADYEPFGKATIKVSTIENNLRFPGQYYDRETGLHYNYFRDYEPGTGRYIEADPIGLEGGMNLYTYVGGNPVSAIDPLGLLELSDVGNFVRGMGSYYRGLYRAGRQIARTSGLMGDCEQERAEQENAALGAGLRVLSNPDVASRAWNEASKWVNQNKSYLGGRLTAGAVTTAGAGLYLYGGVSLGLLAGMGDALHGIENAADSHSDIIESLLGRNHPELQRGKRCGCQ